MIQSNNPSPIKTQNGAQRLKLYLYGLVLVLAVGVGAYYLQYGNQSINFATQIIRNRTSLSNRYVPQYSPPQGRTSNFDCTNVTTISQGECEDLVALYNSTNGPQWTNQLGWLTDSDPCNWHSNAGAGVFCQNDPSIGAYVHEIILYNNNLEGPITSLNNLTKIHIMNLNRNKITSLPALDKLTNLGWLLVGENKLTSIPSLDALVNLKELNISENQISSLPSLDKQTQLVSLWAYSNKLTSLPSLDNLVNLQFLYASRNQLVSLPSLINLPKLQSIAVDYNQLTQLSSLDNQIELYSLSAYGNKLTTLPSLNNQTKLVFINAGDNQITTLPPLHNLINLETLSLYLNKLTSLPSLNGLVKLSNFAIAQNRICDLQGNTDHGNFFYTPQDTSDCGSTHLVCNGNACVAVGGADLLPGEISCTTATDCGATSATHLACVNNACAVVPGATLGVGETSCTMATSATDCGASVPVDGDLVISMNLVSQFNSIYKYKITVTNNSTEIARNFTLKNYFPESDISVNYKSNGGITSYGNHTVTRTIQELKPGTSNSKSFFVDLKNLSRQDMVNKAELCGFNDPNEPVFDNTPCNMGPDGEPSESDEAKVVTLYNS